MKKRFFFNIILRSLIICAIIMLFFVCSLSVFILCVAVIPVGFILLHKFDENLNYPKYSKYFITNVITFFIYNIGGIPSAILCVQLLELIGIGDYYDIGTEIAFIYLFFILIFNIIYIIYGLISPRRLVKNYSPEKDVEIQNKINAFKNSEAFLKTKKMLLKLKNIILYIMIAFVIINFIIEWIFPDKIYDLMFNLCNNNEIYFSDISNFSFYFLILTFILIVVNLIYDSYVNKKFVFKIIYIPIILLLDVTVFFTVPFNYLWLGYRFGDYEDYKSYVFDKTFTYTNIYLSEGELNGNSETKKYFYLPFINKIYFIDSDGIKGYNITINHDSDTVIIGDDKYIIQSNYFSDSYYDYDYDDE